ncbi:hypothetical protein [Nakamurella leprariae]|uniref:Abi family protein n=1 Tax=Nakamurella leprariae TaxID=2803911 RepID=A0A938Y8W3_9ACTN|nr:hypothetical protein [Nakamurella leprariae]MBM9467985.1 hypothetical protein [Nakamurella leprariae]
MCTYDRAAGSKGPAVALELYEWNARVSAALLVPLHVCEVVLRNAISAAIEQQYGHRWPWSDGFHRSLPSPRTSYKPGVDLVRARDGMPTTGKVIPELKFVFWQSMMTSRHDKRIWNRELRAVFPNVDPNQAIAAIRSGMYGDLETLRLLRNRIAHHEPVFTRNLTVDLETIVRLIGSVSIPTADWLNRFDAARGVIASKP